MLERDELKMEEGVLRANMTGMLLTIIFPRNWVFVSREVRDVDVGGSGGSDGCGAGRRLGGQRGLYVISSQHVSILFITCDRYQLGRTTNISS